MWGGAAMAIEDKLRARLEELIKDGETLSVGDTEWGGGLDQQHIARCRGWLGAADNALSFVCSVPNDPYRKAIERILARDEGGGALVNYAVGELTELLRRVLADIDDGLLISAADQARAETFDDLLDHAESYLNEDRKEGSGILATAVFEDTIRRIGHSHGIRDKQLDNIFSELQKQGVITSIDAKACRFAAGVRNEALHANWDGFELPDVKRTIDLTRELLKEHLAG